MLRKIAVLIASFSIMSACAVAAAPANVTPQQAAAIAASCTTIMGLHLGEFAYATCRESLNNSASGLVDGQARLQAYDTCRSRGMPAGTPALSTCMLDSERTLPVQAGTVAATSDALALPQDKDALKAGSSYFSVTHEVQWRREQYSCAQLGLLPGSAAFVHCVASLDADLLPDQP